MLSIDPQWLVFQIILFLAVWMFLRKFLFEPHLAVLQQRTQRSEGALKEAQQVRADAESIETRYKTQLAETRTGTMQQVDTVYRAAEEQAKVVTDEARSEANQTLANMRASLLQEIEAARKDLESRTPEFARTIAEKLLGRPLT
ncbi:MAG: ATP synthase F0 subunit B [Deltaproteobacteria bacterium]|nr:ATP synthase F0 subunit B [Deltaproteobacteria bacterium]